MHDVPGKADHVLEQLEKAVTVQAASANSRCPGRRDGAS
jgi:hypothetical protein